ncbi:hypothetical protein DFH08DRAFT_904083 [Mycena albidolilacea]|uniref:Uncharacterized protein n=1 Tax=Mycena albidolilacea TaxID=1033008 RepID=A0AAD6Z120_9AGAR|nr:hypothetical protein DFH08DRAFT_904083 [Mycena albidolilacea]
MSSKKLQGPFPRENRNISIPGAATFALGRHANVEGQAVKALAAIGVRASNTLVTAGPSVAGLGHVLTLLTGMYIIADIRHAIRSKSLAYWALFTSDNYCSTGSSLGIAVQHSRNFTECIEWKQWSGLALFVIRISMEMIAENSRKKFRKDRKNKGKIDDTGLCHPNYLGFLLGHTGISLVTMEYKKRVPYATLPGLY